MPSLCRLESSYRHGPTASLLTPSSACPPQLFVKQNDQSHHDQQRPAGKTWRHRHFVEPFTARPERAGTTEYSRTKPTGRRRSEPLQTGQETMGNELDWIDISAIAIGLFLLRSGTKSRWFKNQVIARNAERKTAAAIRERTTDFTQLAHRRILSGPHGSCEIDLVVATPNALYIVETKY